MSLDISKLENVHTVNGNTIARCPACAEDGEDASGDHLFITKDGKYGCVSCPGADGREHRKRIFALIGLKTQAETGTKKNGRKAHATRDAAREAVLWSLQKRTKSVYHQVGSWVYHDHSGAVVFEVFRLETDAGAISKQYVPIHPIDGGWRVGDPPGPLPLYNLPELLVSSGMVYVVEGEKCADALIALGFAATASAHGAKSAGKTDCTPLAGRAVIIVPDNDDAGQNYADTVAETLLALSPPALVQILELPGLDALGKGADVVDWQAHHVPASTEAIRAELIELSKTAPHYARPGPDGHTSKSPKKPSVLLPGGTQTISGAGSKLGKLLAANGSYYNRGGAVVRVKREPTGTPCLTVVYPAALASDFEAVANLYNSGPEGVCRTYCPEQTAKLISVSADFMDELPPIHVVTRCPVLIEREGRLTQIFAYDRESGILAAGPSIEENSIQEAKMRLDNLTADFHFASLSDRARALAAFLTPALVFGNLLGGRAPIDLGEADDSQAGKGYRNKITAAIYGQKVHSVTQKKGGVGGLEESFNAKLITGANFIAFDNVRGRIDSPALESFMTEDSYSARMPYKAPVDIDPSRVVVLFTSNKADITPDLANRSSCVRILKQPVGYVFRTYPEGDILDHVRANQAHYLGAVFAIIKAWYAAGKPRTQETRHDFRRWAQTLDWIVQNLLDAGPLLDGHRETQARMTNPVLNWLRDVALDIIRAKQSGAWLRAGEIVDLLAEMGIEIPGLPEHGDLSDPEIRKTVQQATGRKLGLCFRASDHVDIDGMTIQRREQHDAEGRYDYKEYRFDSAANEHPPTAAGSAAEPSNGPTPDAKNPSDAAKTAFCGYSAANGAASPAAKKPFTAANAADATLKGQHHETKSSDSNVHIASIGTISRIAATAAAEEPAKPHEQGYKLVSRSDSLGDIAAQITASLHAVALDIETYGDRGGLNPWDGEIRLLTLAIPGHEPWILDLKAIGYNLGPLAPVLSTHPVLGHNIKFDVLWLCVKCGLLLPNLLDTMTASRLLTAGSKLPNDLGAVVERHAGVTLAKDQARSDWGAMLLTDEQMRYAKDDVRYLHRAHGHMMEQLNQDGLAPVYAAEMQLLPHVVTMEAAGFLVDQEKLAGIHTQARADEDQATAALREAFGDDSLNPASPKQLLEALARQGIHVTKTNEETLRANGDTRLIPHILAVRAANKQAEQAKKLLESVASDGRIHARFEPTGTETGRFSCKEPNLQNIGRGPLRSCFVAAPENVLVVSDYSQIELRIAAVIANETRMIEAYRRGEDLHRQTAALVLNKPADKVTKDDRQLAKAVNFGLLYGQKPPGLVRYAKTQYGVSLSLEQAQEFHARFFKAYGNLGVWHEQARRTANSATEVRTISGRRRLFPGGEDAWWARFTAIVNTPVQGGAAEGMKDAIIQICTDLPVGARLISTIHDEVIVEVPTSLVAKVRDLVEQSMKAAMTKLFPQVLIEVEIKLCSTWGEK